MWLYDYMQKNRVLTFSIYSILMVLGSLSLWRMLQGNLQQDLWTYLWPIFLSIGIVMLLVLFYQRDRVFFFRVISIISVLVISPLFYEMSGVKMEIEEIMLSFFYLLAVSSSITLFLSEFHSQITRFVQKTLLFSILFIIIFLISQVLVPERPHLFLIVIVGQMVSYVVTMMFLSMTKQIMIKEEEFSNKESDVKIKTYPFAMFWLIVYIGLIIFSSYFVFQQLQHLSLLLIWFISLFLLSAIYNSFRKPMVIHFLMLSLFIVLWAGQLLYFEFLQDIWVLKEEEFDSLIMSAVFLLWGIGLQPILMAVLTTSTSKKTYLIAALCFILPLLPIFVGSGFHDSIKILTLIFILGFVIVSVAIISMYTMFYSLLFQEKRRANRPFILNQPSNEQDNTQVQRDLTKDSQLQERELTYLYRDWLVRRELQLEEETRLAMSKNSEEPKNSNIDD